MALAVGQAAPNFTLPSTSGTDFTLNETLKNQNCVIFFYPKDFTPGCTAEVCDFRDNIAAFSDIEIPVIGISTDSVATHLKFKAKHNLPYELLADKKGIVSEQYEALIPFVKLSKRVTYLIDKEHNIAGVYSDMFGAKNHMREILSKISK